MGVAGRDRESPDEVPALGHVTSSCIMECKFISDSYEWRHADLCPHSFRNTLIIGLKKADCTSYTLMATSPLITLNRDGCALIPSKLTQNEHHTLRSARNQVGPCPCRQMALFKRRGVHGDHMERKTLHYSIGHVKGSRLRARNVLQHGLGGWPREVILDRWSLKT